MVAVTVIVPVHNGEGFLDETERQLEAMLAATSAAVEVLVIDDHSTDRSLEIISTWPARLPGVRVLSAEGRGVARARNQAVAAALGQYVWFTDADDAWQPRIVQIMLDTASLSSADLVVANARKLLADGTTRLIEDAPHPEQYDARETLARVLDGRVQGHLWNKLFSRALLGTDPFPPTRAHSDLGGLLSLIPQIGTTAAVPETVYDYVIRAGSILNNSDYQWQDLHDCLAIAEKVNTALLTGNRAQLAIFRCQNVAIPTANECIRRRSLLPPEQFSVAISTTRTTIRPYDIVTLLRAGKRGLAARAFLLRFLPTAYFVLFTKFHRGSAIPAGIA